MKKRKWLSLLLAVMMLVSAVPFFPVTADAADGTVVEVSTWAELKKALDYTTNCSVVKVVKDIETKSLNGNTGLHQDNIIFMTMAIPSPSVWWIPRSVWMWTFRCAAPVFIRIRSQTLCSFTPMSAEMWRRSIPGTSWIAS